MKMRKLLIILGIVLPIIISCKKQGCIDPTAINYNINAQKDDGSCKYETSTNVIKSGFINNDETWIADSIYELRGKVIVPNGVTLTIEPGTIIKGDEGSGTLASALIIAKGGKIYAIGTPSQPIIFTSTLDNIQVGEQSGTNLNETDNGMWGGVIILGNAPISAADGDVITQIEGIPVTDTYGAYGGSNPMDNSGVFKYISIRHGGALIGAGNEINGLTLGGVGSDTQISNIEIVANLDDGVEFFGGTVDASNIIIGYQGDDGIDIDMNYAGSISSFQVINGMSSDESIEIDGPEGMTNINGLFTLSNGITNGDIDLKSKAQGYIDNVTTQEIKIRCNFELDCTTDKIDAYKNLVDGTLTLSDVNYIGLQLYTTTDCTIPTSYQSIVEGLIQNTISQVNVPDWSWTWLSTNGKL